MAYSQPDRSPDVGLAIWAPQIVGAQRLIPLTRGFNRIRCKPVYQAGFRRTQRKPSAKPLESRTQNCVVLDQRLTGYAPHRGAQSEYGAALHRANANRCRDLLAPLNLGNSHVVNLTDHDVPALLNAGNVGIAPQTAGNIRRRSHD
jgi:hypothetical protein